MVEPKCRIPDELLWRTIEEKLNSFRSRVKALTLCKGKAFAVQHVVDQTPGIMSRRRAGRESSNKTSMDRCPLHSQKAQNGNCHR